MKKTQRIRSIAVLILLAVLVMALSACGNERENSEVTETESSAITGTEEQETETEAGESDTEPVAASETEEPESETGPVSEEYSDILVVYFSHTGNTKPVAEYIFSSLNLMGSAWGRKIHLVGTAWLLLLSGVQYGMHLAAGKRNIALYVAGVLGIAAFVILRFHERLFLISEFAYAPDIPWWCIYLMHGLMFVAFMATGVLIKRLSGKIRNTGGMKEWA